MAAIGLGKNKMAVSEVLFSFFEGEKLLETVVEFDCLNDLASRSYRN
jgi:hypothetical protein